MVERLKRGKEAQANEQKNGIFSTSPSSKVRRLDLLRRESGPIEVNSGLVLEAFKGKSQSMADFSGCYAPVAPDTIAMNEKLAQIMLTLPSYRSQDPAVIRAEREAGIGPFGKLVLDEKATSSVVADVPVRIFKPETV